MELRLTDGSQYKLSDCRQEYNPEDNKNIFVCVFAGEYDFNELSQTLKKDEIAEILSVIDGEKFIFQTTDYPRIKSVIQDIATQAITVTFTA